MVKDISIHLSLKLNYSTTDHRAWARLFGNESIVFPMLESLTLDFTEWALGDKQGLLVSAPLWLIVVLPFDFSLTFLQARPLIDRFRGPLGLRNVVVKGVKHKKSLQQLKKGLMREGGRFRVQGD